MTELKKLIGELLKAGVRLLVAFVLFNIAIPPVTMAVKWLFKLVTFSWNFF